MTKRGRNFVCVLCFVLAGLNILTGFLFAIELCTAVAIAFGIAGAVVSEF